jgi:lysophospholipid hydrolase
MNLAVLVDGGYVDNLPVETMMSIGPATVIAVDVGSIDDTRPRIYGDSVSGFGILFRRLNPFSQRQVLSMTEVSSRLT